MEREKGWCRDERLRLGLDQLIERTPDYTLVKCVAELHDGHWILWAATGKCEAIGPEDWCRKQLKRLIELAEEQP